MMKWKWYIPLSCLVVFHTPDHAELQVESNHIIAVRPLSKGSAEHVAAGVKTLIYTGVQKFGVTETHAQVDAILQKCGN